MSALSAPRFTRRSSRRCWSPPARPSARVWLQDLRRDVFPDLSAPVFNVIVQNAAMGAEELETAIAIPLEVGSPGLPDVRRIRSNSQLGVAQVTVEFEPDADYYRSRQFVAERVAQAAGQLPPGTDPPLISSLTGRLNEIFEFTLEADAGAADLMTLRDLAEFEVKNRLLAVPGVAAVERLGGYLRQFQVQLDPERMSARRVTLDEVLHAVEESNLNASGGIVAQGPIEWTVRAVGRCADHRGPARHRGDRRAATSRCCWATWPTCAKAPRCAGASRIGCAGEVVSARVTKQFGADTVQVAAGIRQAVDDIRRGLPQGRPAAHRLRPVGAGDVGAGRRGPRGDARRRVRRAGDPVAAGQRARGADRHADDSAVDRPGRPAAAPAGRRAEHDDPRRAGHRGRAAGRCRDHHGREHPAPPGGRRDAGRAARAGACRRPSRWPGPSRSPRSSSSWCSCRSSACPASRGGCTSRWRPR